MRFDPKTGVRERLALLASQGPEDLADWSYDPRFNRWFRFERGGHMRRVDVILAPSQSLELIAVTWNIDHDTALKLCEEAK